MIHLVTLDPFVEPTVSQVRSRLYLAFGVGCEHAGQLKDPVPRKKGAFDAHALLVAPTPFDSYTDDRVLYLTRAELLLPEGPLGTAPSGGFSTPRSGCAVVTASGVPAPPENTSEDDEAWLSYGDRLGRLAVQHMGFLWGLRRCLDHHCAMAIPWAEEVSDTDANLCEFCRGKSEVLLQQARS
ncbi:MAG: hypothetical protein P1V51_07875 [Deltaproteobacteria bacterium]|nr:hypothetical protein [Deltaproteobacteria bacterium]